MTDYQQAAAQRNHQLLIDLSHGEALEDNKVYTRRDFDVELTMTIGGQTIVFRNQAGRRYERGGLVSMLDLQGEVTLDNR